METITLDLPFPPSVNEAYGNGGVGKGRHKTDVYTTWFALASINVKDRHRKNITGPYTLYMALKRRDNRRRDLGNYEKAVSDFLVSHGVVKDDSQSVRIVIEWDDFQQCECRVIVHPLPETRAA